MAEQKDQTTNPPADIMDSSRQDFKKQLEQTAYYSVYRAFVADDNPTLLDARINILGGLRKEWKISMETHLSCEAKIQEVLAQEQTGDSSACALDEKEMQKEQEKPLTKHATSKSGSSWGSVNPESLIKKWVCIRFPNENAFTEYLIKEYDVKQERHLIEIADSNAMERDEMLSWIDIRAIQHKDIMWENGERPDFGSSSDFSIRIKKEKLAELQNPAYYDVLKAFNAESSLISRPRSLILRELMKEWNIDHITHTAYEITIKADPMIQKLRKVSLASDEKAKQKITGVDGQPLTIRTKPSKDYTLKIRDQVLAPAKIQDGKVIPPAEIQTQEDKPSSTSDDSPVPSWGQVSPGSLVGRRINIRMPGEEDYIGFLVKQYDAETEMHELVPILSKKDYVDPCNWIDIRHIPVEDIVWTEKNPDLPVWKCFLKPGETLLHETSTTRQKKQLKEVGKTSTGIPIIRKADKGKSIA